MAPRARRAAIPIRSRPLELEGGLLVKAAYWSVVPGLVRRGPDPAAEAGTLSFALAPFMLPPLALTALAAVALVGPALAGAVLVAPVLLTGRWLLSRDRSSGATGLLGPGMVRRERHGAGARRRPAFPQPG
jgi:hypothetical protein